MKKITSVLLVVVLAVLVSGCGNNSDIPTSTSKSNNTITVESMGEKLNYAKPPEKIIALGYDLAEMIVMLGEGDRIIALSPCMYFIDNVKEEYRNKIASIEVLPDGLSKGVPTLETVLSKNPDFVLGYSYSFYENAAGTPKDYMSKGINFYAIEGTYVSDASIENTYNDFVNLGKILGKQQEAERIVAEMRNRISSVEAAVKDIKPVSVFVYDNGSAEKPTTIGGLGFQNSLVKLAGGRNIFDDIKSDFASISIEELIERNPDVIVIVEYYESDDGKEKINLLNSIPELSTVKAVKDENYIVVSGYSFFPCAQNVELVEKLASGFHNENYN